MNALTLNTHQELLKFWRVTENSCYSLCRSPFWKSCSVADDLIMASKASDHLRYRIRVLHSEVFRLFACQLSMLPPAYCTFHLTSSYSKPIFANLFQIAVNWITYDHSQIRVCYIRSRFILQVHHRVWSWGSFSCVALSTIAVIYSTRRFYIRYISLQPAFYTK